MHRRILQQNLVGSEFTETLLMKVRLTNAGEVAVDGILFG